MTIDEKLASATFYLVEDEFRGLFRELRRTEPVRWTRALSGPGYWSLFKHRDVMCVLDDPEGFSSEREGVMPIFEEGMKKILMEAPGAGHNVLLTDPPRHAPLRKVISPPFQPKALKDASQRIARLAAEAFDEVPESGEIDLVEDLGTKIPMRVICGMLDIPREDWGSMLRWGRMATGSTDPEFQDGRSRGETMLDGFRLTKEYAGRLAESRRGCPFSDPLTALASAKVDGQPLTPLQIAFNGQQLMLAGFETTRNAFAGGVYQLLVNPSEMAKLRADPALVRRAVEEMVRFTDPVMSMMRVATKDTEIGGQAIGEGQRVVLWFASANRDEEQFEHPDEFDVSRFPNDHVGFGAGPHFCLGAALARMELRASLEELLERYEGLEIIGTVERVESNYVGGLKRIPVRLRKRTASSATWHRASSDGLPE